MQDKPVSRRTGCLVLAGIGAALAATIATLWFGWLAPRLVIEPAKGVPINLPGVGRNDPGKFRALS